MSVFDLLAIACFEERHRAGEIRPVLYVRSFYMHGYICYSFCLILAVHFCLTNIIGGLCFKFMQS